MSVQIVSLTMCVGISEYSVHKELTLKFYLLKKQRIFLSSSPATSNACSFRFKFLFKSSAKSSP